MAYEEETPFNLLSIVAAILGDDGVDRVLDACAGRNIWVPVKAAGNESNPLVAALGVEDAQKICDQLANTPHYVRMDRQRRAHRLLDAGGMSMSNIAKASGLSERQVYNINAARRRKRAEVKRLASLSTPEPKA